MADLSDPPGLAPLATPERARLVDQIVDILIDAVLDGRYPPGSVLPPERELAEAMGVNRTSLRQATARLAQVGLVEARQGIGTVVQDPAGTTDAALMAQFLMRVGPDLLEELLEVREALGGLAGRLAARHARSDDVDLVRSALDLVEASTDAADLQAAELAFFATLVSAAHNRPLRAFISWVEQVYGSAAPSFRAAFTDADLLVPAIREIAGAVVGGDEVAAEAAVVAYARASAQRLLAAARRDQDATRDPGRA